jgi:hypothetical protein
LLTDGPVGMTTLCGGVIPIAESKVLEKKPRKKRMSLVPAFVKTIQPRRGGNALVFGAFRPRGGRNAEDVVGFT